MKRTVALALLACAPGWAATALPTTATPPAAPTSQQEQNKAIARRVFEKIFNQGKFQVADEIYAPDFVNHGLHTDADLQVDQAAVHFEKQACPDLKITYGPMVAEGDLVSVLWVFRGTNTARSGWVPATGAKIEVKGITIWRIDDGRIREEWTSMNELTIIREVAYQVRWQLLGLACMVLILLWIAARIVRRLLFRRRPA
ncbi:MAG: ester cyclase [Terracidiphilus sp.]